jgi:hypothetical protein
LREKGHLSSNESRQIELEIVGIKGSIVNVKENVCQARQGERIECGGCLAIHF